ncbi:hypothetical protein GCM10009722_31510 [Williamsia deligens]|nr:Methyltransferase domain-containing protein [Williamsia deligens]
MTAIARQLGHPSGLGGRLIGAALNRGNRNLVRTAADALHAAEGSVVADVGFGGGVGLPLLLDAVGNSGHVHGVEVSETMINQAARRHHRAIAAGRLVLHPASMTELPVADRAWDSLMTVNTIYFLADLDPALRECTRVLTDTGRLVVGLADPEAMARLPFTAHGFRLRPVAEVVDAMKNIGLSVEHRRIADDEESPHLLIGRVDADPHRGGQARGPGARGPVR